MNLEYLWVLLFFPCLVNAMQMKTSVLEKLILGTGTNASSDSTDAIHQAIEDLEHSLLDLEKEKKQLVQHKNSASAEVDEQKVIVDSALQAMGDAPYKGIVQPYVDAIYNLRGKAAISKYASEELDSRGPVLDDEIQVTEDAIKSLKASIGASEEVTFFNDKGDTTLETTDVFSYNLANGFTVELTGWSHTRDYAKGYLRNVEGTGSATIKNLEANKMYFYEIYMFASAFANKADISINGELKFTSVPTSQVSPLPAAVSGKVTANNEGQIVIEITHAHDSQSHHIHLSGLSVWPEA